MDKLKLIWIVVASTCVDSYSQDSIVMPITGNGGFYNTCYATIWDNGLDSNYADFSNSTVTISPLWTESIHLYFEVFETENFFDQLKIYDGPGVSFPLIGSYSGTQLQGQSISSTGNSITLEFISDDILTKTGFKALVSCTLGQEENHTSNLILYPNPVTDFIHLINLPQESIHEIICINEIGQETCKFNVSEKIYVGNLPYGFYGLLIQLTNGKTIFKKWIKA